MPVFLANPWGLLGLLAVPALVAVHLLQEKSRRVRTSTLFLLEHARPEAAGGWRIDRFRNSLPFWLQLVAILAATWLLTDPRIVRADSRQTVAVVLDSSASLRAVREETLALLARRLGRVAAGAARTDWHLLETGPRRPPLYAGPRLDELLAAAGRWRPALGTHAPDDALAVAAALVPADSGCVILVTDRPAETPAGVAVLSAGEPFDNVGFTGGDVRTRDGRTTWRAIVTNHGRAEQSRSFFVRRPGDAPAAARPIVLPPGGSRTLEGDWPDEAGDRLELVVAADRFDLDDTLPLVRPRPRIVRVADRLEGPAGGLLGRMVAAAGDTEPVAAPADADLVIAPLGGDPGRFCIQAPAAAAGDGRDSADSGAADGGEDGGQAADKATGAAAAGRAFDPAWVTAEAGPLTRDLGWGGLLSGPAVELAAAPGDRPLLWKGGRPLAALRPGATAAGRPVESLVLAWDLAASTAARTPAVVVLVQRFVERARSAIDRPWADNFETGEIIELPGGRQARAAAEPGFFTWPAAAAGDVPAGDATGGAILTGAAHFADAREGDFRGAAAADTLEPLRWRQALKASVADPWWPLWAAVAAAALLAAWAWKGGGR
jgi:hypothetical protein